MTTATHPPRAGTNSLTRLLRVMSAVENAPKPITVPEVAQIAELPLSSTYRLVGVLKDSGRVERLSDGTYRAVSERRTALDEAAGRIRAHLPRAEEVSGLLRADLELLLALVPTVVTS